jgi:predicted O-linked N-acetylglucosamine transferase (SPINDLY family)
MAELFESHDRGRFELIAVSFGPPSDDPWRRRAVAAFDAFHDVSLMSNREIAKFARTLELDVAIDLKGYTADHRAEIFVHRVAPIQINYLGYPATLGMASMDYILGDPIVIGDPQHYTEEVLRLPGCYQPNCKTRAVASGEVRRADFGLPDEAFVFCSFNAQYKITPTMFDAWMTILRQVEGSVLWVLVTGDEARRNLLAEAERRGVSAGRIVFASPLPVERHLQRIPLADLMLDTSPYGAHTTGSDCLRMGVPIVTLRGQSFAARVCASLLHAVGLEGLVAESRDEYVRLAVELGRDARGEGLRTVTSKLKRASEEATLFDPRSLARALEAQFDAVREALNPSR